MIEGIKLTEKEGSDNIHILITDGEFSGCEFFFDGLKFADEANEDGSMNMSFDYEITNGFVVSDAEVFGRFLGDLLLKILEEQMKTNEVVYSGGE